VDCSAAATDGASIAQVAGISIRSSHVLTSRRAGLGSQSKFDACLQLVQPCQRGCRGNRDRFRRASAWLVEGTDIKIVSIAVIGLALAGCAPQPDPVADADRKLLDMQSTHDLACVKGFPRLRVGMTETEVMTIMLPCYSDHKNTTQTAGTVREQWVYTSHLGQGFAQAQGPAFPPQYLYFEGGRLQGIQTSD
jgi:hypothetical protein